MDDINNVISGVFDFSNLSDMEVRVLNPLEWAYIGDAVYELYVRSHTLSLKKGGIHEHHIESVKFAKAKSQAKMLISIMPHLSLEEQDIVRRGRNTKTNHIPKNADVLEYRQATAFEALIGYLYLSRKYSRVSEIMKMVFEIDKSDVKIEN